MGPKTTAFLTAHRIYSKSMLLKNKNLPDECTEKGDPEKIWPKSLRSNFAFFWLFFCMFVCFK